MATRVGSGELAQDAPWASGDGQRAGARASLRATRARTLSEDRLASRAAAGDEDAFVELYRRYHQSLFRYALALLHNPEDAADVLQTTMAKALAALEAGERVRGVRPWLFRIAHNASIDLIRRRRPQSALDELAEIESSSLTAPSAAAEVEGRAELAEAVADIRTLPERQQSALVMRELSALAYSEIARALATSEPAGRQLVHQARTTLHERRRGRAMDCEPVRQAISERDGKTPRDRQMRAHLAVCDDCRAFQASIRERRVALAALFPPLAPAAASEIFARLVEGGSNHGAGLAAASGGVLGGGIAKIVGASTGAKVAAAAAAGTLAVAAGGGVIAAGGLLGGDGDRPARERSQAAVPGFLRPKVPELRDLPSPSDKRGGATAEASEPAGGAGGAGSAGDAGGAGSAAAPTELASIAPLDGRGPVARPSGVEVPEGRGPVEVPLLGGLGRDGDGSVDLPGGGGRDLGGNLPDVDVPNVDLPGGGVDVDLPGGGGVGVNVPGGGVDVDGPRVNVPPINVPGTGVSVPGGGTSVNVPDVSVDLPAPQAPNTGSLPDIPSAIPTPSVGIQSDEGSNSGAGEP